MKDRLEDMNIPQITTYRTFDSTSAFAHRGTSQRTIQLPIAEVAPIPKLNIINQPSFEKSVVDLQQQTAYKGLRKIESLRMPATSTELNHIRYKIFPIQIETFIPLT